jgi:hypothetical protein
MVSAYDHIMHFNQYTYTSPSQRQALDAEIAIPDYALLHPLSSFTHGAASPTEPSARRRMPTRCRGRHPEPPREPPIFRQGKP